MDELIVICNCGAAFAAPRSAFNSDISCETCGAAVHVSSANARELTQAERDVRLFLADDEPLPPPLSSYTQKQAKPVSQPVKNPSGILAAQGEILRDKDGRAIRHPLSSGGAYSGKSTPQAPKPQPFFDPSNNHAEAKVPRCARCQKPFRGDWDKIDSDEGPLCHICGNNVDNFTWGAAPASPAASEQSEVMREIAKTYSWGAAEPPPEEPKNPNRRLYMFLFLCISIATTITLVYFAPGDLTVPANTGIAQPPQEMSLATQRLVVGINAFLEFIAMGIAIYLTLLNSHKLPNETFIANVIAVGIVAALVVAVNWIPGAGYLIGIIILYLFYELSFMDVIMLMLFGFFARILTRVVAALIFNMMGINQM
jgi:DNA-directed RNA polymerase subunit RPC12/RpoP